MIRRHITPALIAAAFFLFSYTARPLGTGGLWAGLVPALVAAAAGIVLVGHPQPSAFPAGARRFGLLTLSASAGLLLGAFSIVRMSNESAGAFLSLPGESITSFSGALTEDSVLSRKGYTVMRLALRQVASADWGVASSARGKTLVIVGGDYRFSIGERMTIAAKLSPQDSEGPERYVARAERRDIRTAGFENRLWEARAEARQWLHRTVSGIGYPASALLEALLIGSREDVPDSLSSAFTRTGSLHILALSGLHVTVLFGVFSLLLGFLKSRWLKFGSAALLLLFYQVLAGFMPSLLRATVMILVGGIGLLLDRDREPLNLLAVASIVILLIDPFQAYTLSFQLSFLALAGILVIGPLVQRPLEGRLPAVLLLPLAMSIGAQAGTFPLVVASFGAWYPSGILAGLILVPLTTGMLWAGLAWLPLSLVAWPSLHGLCARAFAGLYQLIEGSAETLARLPGVVIAPAASPWVAATAVCLLACLGFLLPRRFPRWRRA